MLWLVRGSPQLLLPLAWNWQHKPFPHVSALEAAEAKDGLKAKG